MPRAAEPRGRGCLLLPLALLIAADAHVGPTVARPFQFQFNGSFGRCHCHTPSFACAHGAANPPANLVLWCCGADRGSHCNVQHLVDLPIVDIAALVSSEGF